ncbi:MAG TPA: hypothetical protein VK995_04460 [Oceanipulchritudo sp.]|nr:hypothetical protein [Oceanipulchritudo sp.]
MRQITHTKPLQLIPLCLPLIFLSGTSLEAGIILLEDFETDGSGTRYTATGEFTDAVSDYFTRTDGLTDPSGIPPYTGFGGSWFWALEDTDSPDNTAGATLLDFTGIDLTDTSSFRISLDIGAGSGSAFDSVDDFLLVQYRIDAGNWETALAFQNNGQTFNGPLMLDTDFDGIGDAFELGLAMQTISSAAFPVSGLFMDLRIDTLMTSGSEAVAFDNITVMSVPEPQTTALAFSIASLLLILGRHFLLQRENESRA